MSGFDRLEPESLAAKINRLWRLRAERAEAERAPCFICQFPKDLHDPDGSHLWSPRVVAHEPGAQHRYRIRCIDCGQQGTIRLAVDPETVPVPGEEADHG